MTTIRLVLTNGWVAQATVGEERETRNGRWNYVETGMNPVTKTNKKKGLSFISNRQRPLTANGGKKALI
jgi:hypothetical protein